LQLTPHTPLLQVALPLSGAAQALPQVPQFCVSVEALTHSPLHDTNPRSQLTPQIPSVHVAAPLLGTLHAAPQVLQFAGSAVGSVQLLPQRVKPLSHSARHTPREHTSSGPHCVPQLPQ